MDFSPVGVGRPEAARRQFFQVRPPLQVLLLLPGLALRLLSRGSLQRFFGLALLPASRRLRLSFRGFGGFGAGRLGAHDNLHTCNFYYFMLL
jgi:hypothetical protein